MVRFVVAEDGWYSATAEFKGLDGGDAYGYVFVGGVDCAAGADEAAFNGAQISGVFPPYVAAGTLLVVR